MTLDWTVITDWIGYELEGEEIDLLCKVSVSLIRDYFIKCPLSVPPVIDTVNQLFFDLPKAKGIILRFNTAMLVSWYREIYLSPDVKALQKADLAILLGIICWISGQAKKSDRSSRKFFNKALVHLEDLKSFLNLENIDFGEFTEKDGYYYGIVKSNENRNGYVVVRNEFKDLVTNGQIRDAVRKEIERQLKIVKTVLKTFEVEYGKAS